MPETVWTMKPARIDRPATSHRNRTSAEVHDFTALAMSVIEDSDGIEPPTVEMPEDGMAQGCDASIASVGTCPEQTDFSNF